MLDKLLASRKANAGGFNLRQIILGTFDQTIHTRGSANTQELFSSIYKQILDVEPVPNTNMPASWGHMVGYDAQYYGYLVRTSFQKAFENDYIADFYGFHSVSFLRRIDLLLSLVQHGMRTCTTYSSFVKRKFCRS